MGMKTDLILLVSASENVGTVKMSSSDNNVRLKETVKICNDRYDRFLEKYASLELLDEAMVAWMKIKKEG